VRLTLELMMKHGSDQDLEVLSGLYLLLLASSPPPEKPPKPSQQEEPICFPSEERLHSLPDPSCMIDGNITCPIGFYVSPSGCVDVDECEEGRFSCDDVPDPMCLNVVGTFCCAAGPGFRTTYRVDKDELSNTYTCTYIWESDDNRWTSEEASQILEQKRKARQEEKKSPSL
jgi:hypothetical protein